MSHEYHPREHDDPSTPEALASSEPILFDGCAECEGRTAEPWLHLDARFTSALWAKMLEVEFSPLVGAGSYRSHAEAAACKALYYVAIFLQRFTSVDPKTLEVG